MEYDYDETRDVYLSSYSDNSGYVKKYLVDVSGPVKSEVDNMSVVENESRNIDEKISDVIGSIGSVKYWVISGLIILWAISIVLLYL